MCPKYQARVFVRTNNSIVNEQLSTSQPPTEKQGKVGAGRGLVRFERVAPSSDKKKNKYERVSNGHPR